MVEAGVETDALDHFGVGLERRGISSPALLLTWLRRRAARMPPMERAARRHNPNEELQGLQPGGYIPDFAQEYRAQHQQVDRWLVVAVGNA